MYREHIVPIRTRKRKTNVIAEVEMAIVQTWSRRWRDRVCFHQSRDRFEWQDRDGEKKKELPIRGRYLMVNAFG